MSDAAQDVGPSVDAVTRLLMKTPEYAAWIAYEQAQRAQRNVYMFQSGRDGMIKIGNSRNIRQRMTSLQAISPAPLQLLGWMPGGQWQEFRLHYIFKGSRAWGEWFNPTPAILYYAEHDMEHGVPPMPGERSHFHDEALYAARTRIRDALSPNKTTLSLGVQGK